MKKYHKSIVAAGHSAVCDSAAEILGEGGNAFDAVVAAGFTSAATEPALTSLGGGGFMLGHLAESDKQVFVDFFVDTPGRGHANGDLEPHFFPVTVNFSGTSQIFNVGHGSVAVPGTLKGLLHIHSRFGRMSLKDVVTPASQYAAGHVLNGQQGHFLELLKPIMTLTSQGRALYQPDGNFLKEGDVLANSLLADFLDHLVAEGDESFYRGDIAAAIAADMEGGDGLLTREDLASYKVREYVPLQVPYRDGYLLTAPEPSMGGTLIGLSLSLLGAAPGGNVEWGSGAHLGRTVRLMQEVERLREQGITTPAALMDFLDGDGAVKSSSAARLFSRGTTHISIADGEGNCASMTCSNGEGSGYVVPGTGIMLNNMMGEDDLHPDGFHSSPPGLRVASMMSPSMYLKDDEIRLVIGSGGSKRIRTAISQVLSQVVDFGRDLEEAVQAARLYWDEDKVQLEPGFSREAVDSLKKSAHVVEWSRKDVYFGGVHGVIPGLKGAGDHRRGGCVREVEVLADS